MLLSLLFTSFFALTLPSLSLPAQDASTKPIPSAIEWQVSETDPLHRFVELEVDGDGVVVEYVSGVDGWLSVWAASTEVDPALVIELEGRDEPLADEDSGGVTAASLVFEVTADAHLRIQLNCEPDSRGQVELHVVGAPETEATRAAARHAKKELSAIGELKSAGELDAARERMVGLVGTITATPSEETSFGLGEASWPLGVSAYGLQLLNEADRSFGTAHRSRERLMPADHPELLRAKANLAVTRKALGDLQGAKALEEKVLAAYERLLPADHPKLLRVKANLAATRWELGELQGAKALQEEVLAAYESLLPADHPALLLAKANLALTRKSLGDLQGVKALQEEVLAAYERLLPADHPDLLLAKGNLAVTRMELGDLQGAKALFEEVLAAREHLLPADHPDLLTTKQGLAVTREALGDLQAAKALFEEVLAAYERLLPADHPDLLSAKFNLAGMRQALGDLQGARALFEEVLAAWERLLPADHPDLLAAKFNLAATRHALGDLQGARALCEEVLAAYERLLPADHPDLLLAKGNLAAIRGAIGDLQGAKALGEEVLAARERLLPADHPDLLAAKSNLASARHALGDFQGAKALFEEVLAAWERLLPADHPDLLSAKFNLAGMRQALGDLEGLRAACESMVDGQLAVTGSISRMAPRPARAAALGELDRLETGRFLSQSCDLVDAASLEPKLAEVLEGLRCASVSAAQVMRAARRVPELEPTLAELERVRREAAAAARGPAVSEGKLSEEEAEAWRKQLFELSEQRDRLEADVRSALARAGVRSEPPTMEEVAASLSEGEALVSYWRYDRIEEGDETNTWTHTDSLLAYVTTPDGAVRSVELGPAAPLEALALDWRREIGKPLSSRGVSLQDFDEAASTSDAGAKLRSRILDPILAGLPGVSTLHVVLDDFLFLVPLDALPTEEGLVGDEVTLHFLTTVRPLVDTWTRPDGEPRFLGLGDVDYGAEAQASQDEALLAVATPPSRGGGASFAALEGTGPEVEAAADTFETAFEVEPELVLAEDATKAELFRLAPGARYLHIATHGWFVPESEAVSMIDVAQREGERGALSMSLERTQETLAGFLPETLCGLALAGANNGADSLGHVPGILTAEELATLDLSKCELAVLSACETNVGLRRAGQGIQSLQTALHAAGVRTAITSLWKVDDAATRQLFEVFYTKLWLEGLGPADALWQAKQALHAEGQPLRNWAGWVLTGAPD